MFEPFQRLDGRRTRHRNGHGPMACLLVRAIASAHGARITTACLPGGGLSIEVTFPAPSEPDGAAHDLSLASAASGERMGPRKAYAS